MTIGEHPGTQTFSLGALEGHSSFEALVKTVRRCVSLLDISSRYEDDFRGDFRLRQIGPITFSTLMARQQDAVYSTAAARGSSPRYELVCLRRGQISIEQDGHEVSMITGT